MGSALKLCAGQTVFLDTAPFIYFFEENERYVECVSSLLDSASRLNVQIVTSVITYIELLTLPERVGDLRLAAKYRDFLTNSEQVSIYPLNLGVADAAVRFRAKYGLKTPDAVQLGVAYVCGADWVITNDANWEKISDMGIVLVDKLISNTLVA